MYQLNNLDIVILIIIAISSLIAVSRGLIKEVLSIVGWFLATAAIIYFLPITLPFAKRFISSGILSGIVTALLIFIIFFVFWIYSTSMIIGKIRTSKLNGLDRFLGLFFGIMRAFLLIILFNILVSWIIPEDKQSELLTESKYYQLAGSFAKPLEDMIPQETLDLIKEKTKALNEENIDNKENEENEENEENDTLILLEKLAQPKIKKTLKNQNINEQGYKEEERINLEKLIDSVE